MRPGTPDRPEDRPKRIIAVPFAQMKHTHRSDDPLCGLIVTHRRTGVVAARAAELAPAGARQLLTDLSEVVLDAAGRVAIHARAEGIPVGDALHVPVDAGGYDFEGLRGEVVLRLNEDLTHTELLGSALDCPGCVPIVDHGHRALLPFVDPVRRRLGPVRRSSAPARAQSTSPAEEDVAGTAV